MIEKPGQNHCPEARDHPRGRVDDGDTEKKCDRVRTAATLLRVVPEPYPSYSVQMRIATPWLGSSTALYGNLPLSWIRKLGLRKAPLTLIRVERFLCYVIGAPSGSGKMLLRARVPRQDCLGPWDPA